MIARGGYWRWLWAVAATAVFVLGLTEPTAAQERQLLIDPDDRPLVIRGVLDEGTTGFSGNVRMKVTGGDAQEVFLLAPDLHAVSDPVATIDRSNITIPPGIGLEEDQWRDVQVTVTGVEQPGTYEGTLKFQLSGQPVVSPEPLEMRLEAIPRPDVVPVSETSSFQLARSGKFPLIDQWLLPMGMNNGTRIVQFDNLTPAEVPIASAELVMQGERTGYVLGDEDFQLEHPASMPEKQVSQVRLSVDRGTLPPDRYTGALRLRLEGLENPVTANLAMDVRNPPLLPLLVVFFGVVVGRLVGKLAPPGPAAQAQPAQQASWLTRFLEWLAGTPRSAAQPPLRWVRALLFCLLLVLLALLGWETLYIQNGANFGVGGLLDYLGLFLWGLSADIAQRTLQTLPR